MANLRKCQKCMRSFFSTSQTGFAWCGTCRDGMNKDPGKISAEDLYAQAVFSMQRTRTTRDMLRDEDGTYMVGQDIIQKLNTHAARCKRDAKHISNIMRSHDILPPIHITQIIIQDEQKEKQARRHI